MAFRPPNYNQERNERNRAKDRKKLERLQRREQDAQRRKAERDGLAVGEPAPAGIPVPTVPPTEVV